VSDAGNANGGTVDDPCVNAAVVGVDLLSGDGNDPGNPPTRADAAADAADDDAPKAKRKA
jgi:hypothetical protein